VPWSINGPILDLVQEAWQQGGTWPDLPSLHDFEIREYDGDDPEAKELHGRRNAKLRRKKCGTAFLEM